MTTPKKDHSDWGGSVADKWINCSGYVNAVKDLPADTGNIHTAGGTAQHALNELVIKTGKNPEDFIDKPWMGKLPKGITGTYDEGNVERARIWIDAIHEYADPMLFDIKIEEKVTLSSISNDMYGSCDLGAIDYHNKVLLIADYKDGFKEVDVTETPQPPFYAVGFVDTFNIPLDASWRVDYVIVQPKLPKPVTVLRKSGMDVAEWRGVFRNAYNKGTKADAPLVPGKHCNWCRNDKCLARAEQKRLSIRSEFAGPTLPSQLTNEQIANILRVAPEVEAWLSDVQTHALTQALAGNIPPGFQVVAGRAGHRKWLDSATAEEALVATLKDKAFTKKLVTPTQAEKALGTEGYAKVSSLVTQDAGKPCLAPIGSERDNYSKQAQARAEFST